jgi:hypothetical protein
MDTGHVHYLEIKFRVALVRVRIAGEEEDALGRHLALNRKLYTCKLSRNSDRI